MSRRGKTQLKRQLLEKQADRCYWCGEEICLSATIEHIHPRSRGGTDATDNLAMACHQCNQMKANMTASEFVKHILHVFRRFLMSPGFTESREKERTDVYLVGKVVFENGSERFIPPQPKTAKDMT